MRKVFFESLADKQFHEWEKTNSKIFEKIVQLIDEIRRQPFSGTGKPEPLKYHLKGYWSRRITQEHRLVYKVTSDSIIIISCRYHY